MQAIIGSCLYVLRLALQRLFEELLLGFPRVIDSRILVHAAGTSPPHPISPLLQVHHVFQYDSGPFYQDFHACIMRLADRLL
jgi:hypothetical protein